MKCSERLIPGLLATVTWAGLLLQLWLSFELSKTNGRGLVWSFVNYFGYFTILTNLFVALVATAPFGASRWKVADWFAKPFVRGCAVTAIVGVGIAYHVLLRHVWNPQGWQKVADVNLHYIVPIGALLWWIVSPPRKVLWRWAPLWCAWPLVYFFYAMIRGEVLGVYPYYFIDVGKIGWLAVCRNAAALALFFPLLGVLVAGAAKISEKVRA